MKCVRLLSRVSRCVEWIEIEDAVEDYRMTQLRDDGRTGGRAAVIQSIMERRHVSHWPSISFGRGSSSSSRSVAVTDGPVRSSRHSGTVDGLSGAGGSVSSVGCRCSCHPAV